MSKNADLPAMPVIASYFHDGTPSDVQTGLTKRELFAAMAMQGLLASPDPQVMAASSDRQSKWAVIQADALLAALEPKP